MRLFFNLWATAPLRHFFKKNLLPTVPQKNCATEPYFQKILAHKMFTYCTCLLSVSLLLPYVLCLTSPVSCIMSLVSFLLYYVSCLMSPVSCIMSFVSYLLYHVSCLLSLVSCLTSPHVLNIFNKLLDNFLC